MEVSQAKARDDEYVWIQYTPPWHKLDPSKPERGFYVLEKPNVLSAAGSTGHRTWEAALHLAGWLEDGALVNGKRVLELGAGTALLSLLAAQKGALSITATDGDGQTVERIRRTVQRNESNVSCQSYVWGEDTSELAGSGGLSQFDVVLAADVVS
ncbi:MAG: hypothetical protein Q9159_000422 [Coniocarpon cinnabarinum]